LFERENCNYLASILLLQAVEESLKNLNLFHGGVADKQAGKYSGGMKRRLSVAISLIGDPKVCVFISTEFDLFFFFIFLIKKIRFKLSYSVHANSNLGCLYG